MRRRLPYRWPRHTWSGSVPIPQLIVNGTLNEISRGLGIASRGLGRCLGDLPVTPNRDSRTFGVGAAEYKRVIQATLKLFGALAIAMVFIQFDVARGYFAIALPLGLLLLTGDRWLWRRWLNQKRPRYVRLSSYCYRRVN